jgi:hypothetical protein
MIREQGIAINESLRQELQSMRDALKLSGYGSYF